MLNLFQKASRDLESRALVKCSLRESSYHPTSLIDSGADVNVLAEKDWGRIKAEYDSGKTYRYDVKEHCNRRITSFASKSALKIVASFTAWLRVTEAEKPRNFAKFFVNKAKSVLGLASYLSPMCRACNKKPFLWTAEAQEAFTSTKKAIIKCTIIRG